MLRKFVCTILCLCLFFSITFSVGAESGSLKDSSDVSKIEAVAAALYHVNLIQKTHEQSIWTDKNVKALEPIEVYDTSDELHSYIINLEMSGQSAGYVEIGNNKDDYPVLSYSFDQCSLGNAEISNKKFVATSKKVKLQKVVCVSPGQFGTKLDYNDGSADIVFNNQIINISASENKSKPKEQKQKNVESKKIWDNIKILADGITTGDIGTDTDGVTDSLSFETGYSSSSQYIVSGVGDQNQYTSSKWTGPSGCAPTSAYNVYYYWHYTKGFSNLLKNTSGVVDTDQTILELRGAMATDSKGSSLIDRQPAALEFVAHTRDYTRAFSSLHSSPSWSTVKDDIYSYGPSLISAIKQSYYGDHTVTGVGYVEYYYNGSSVGHQFMIVHDNWGSTPTNVYIAYGRNYTQLYSANFIIYPELS